MVKIKFKKEMDGEKVGETVETSKKSAEFIVSEGYAEYVEDSKKKINTGRKPKQEKTIKQKNKDTEIETGDLIFDENKLIRNEPFVFQKIGKNLIGIGVLIPRNDHTYNKEGTLLDTQQKLTPIIIKSDNRLSYVGKKFTEAYKIFINPIPYDLKPRWRLSHIKKYLDKDYKPIIAKDLFEKIRKVYKDFLYFQNESWYDVSALWDMGTYLFMLFKYYPIRELRGLHGTAKTKIMTISGGITFNATDIMVDPSEATLFRQTHEHRPTKYIDEAEKLFYKTKTGKVESDSRAEIINSSYKKGSTVPRQEKVGNHYITKPYHTHSPTVVGSINGLFGATEDRALIQITTKPPKEDNRGESEPNEEDPIFQEIRNELYVFTLDNWQKIEETYNSLENDTTLKNRDFWLWKPLFALAKFIEPELYTSLKKFAELQTDIKKIDSFSEGSTEYNILKAVAALILDNKQPILVKNIIELCEGKYTPKPQTVGRTMNRLGFIDCRKHTMDGNGYEITPELFCNIVYTLNPNFPKLEEIGKLSSLPSSSSSKKDTTNKNKEKEEKKNEDKMKIHEDTNIPKENEDNEDNEGYEGKNEHPPTDDIEEEVVKDE